MTRPQDARPHGQLRQSQLVTMYGPGALVDLPDDAVIVAGLDHWVAGAVVHEERLAAQMQDRLGVGALLLREPAPAETGPDAKHTGVKAWKFPQWFVVQGDTATRGRTRRRRLVKQSVLRGGKFHDGDKKLDVVPIRFVQGCPRGHVNDINWHEFVHSGRRTCTDQLWFEEAGTSGDIADIKVVCGCGDDRELVRATNRSERALGQCMGGQPWLGKGVGEKCKQLARLLPRHATNAYFALKQTVISLPDADEELRRRIDSVWDDFLMHVEDVATLRKDRVRRAKVKNALGDAPDDRVMAEIDRRNAGGGPVVREKVKVVELRQLLSTSGESSGNDVPFGDYFARRLPLRVGRTGPAALISDVVLVQRLREVTALYGFSRFEHAVSDVDGSLPTGDAAPLTREAPTWIPAVQNRGEGIFIGLDRERVHAWLAHPKVKEREARILYGHQEALKRQSGVPDTFPGMPYILAHSLSHMMLTAVSLECGYTSASLRERVYAHPGLGYGFLLYTASPDAEGTLGGLIEVGKRWEAMLERATDFGRLCSSDPVCAKHPPDHLYEERFLHGAACHGCLLISESSCERRNEFLDRALVVGTVDANGAEFFREGGS